MKNKIYNFYTNKDCEVHCEGYPIIYENDTYIYYRKPGNKSLDYVSRTELVDLDTIYNCTYRYFSYYTLATPDEEKNKEMNHRKSIVIDKLERTKQMYYDTYIRYKDMYDSICKQIDKANRELKD